MFCTVYFEPFTGNVNIIIYHIYVYCISVQRLLEFVNGAERCVYNGTVDIFCLLSAYAPPLLHP